MGKAIRYHTGGFCKAVLWHLIACAFLLAQSPLEQAVTLAREKRYAEAQAALAGVAEPSGNSQRIAFHRLKAAIDSGLGDRTAAATEMESALSLAPSDQSLSLATAVAELQAGKLDDALTHAKGAEKTPGGESLRAAIAFELIKGQSYSVAIQLLEQSVAQFPQSPRLYTLLGIAEYATGETAAAILSLELAIEADPGAGDAYRCLSKVVLQSSVAPSEKTTALLCSWNKTVCSALRLRSAREQANRSTTAQAIADLERAPLSDPVATCELGRAYEWTGRLNDARAKMEACVRVNSSAQNHYRLALLYRKLGLADLAQKEFEARRKSLEERPGEGAIGIDDLRPLK